jgi:hypothetical protein
MHGFALAGKQRLGHWSILVATWLIAVTGDSLSPSYYLIGTALLSLIAVLAVQSRSRRENQALALSGGLSVP